MRVWCWCDGIAWDAYGMGRDGMAWHGMRWDSNSTSDADVGADAHESKGGCWLRAIEWTVVRYLGCVFPVSMPACSIYVLFVYWRAFAVVRGVYHTAYMLGDALVCFVDVDIATHPAYALPFMNQRSDVWLRCVHLHARCCRACWRWLFTIVTTVLCLVHVLVDLMESHGMG
jgi:hypothetical protein